MCLSLNSNCLFTHVDFVMISRHCLDVEHLCHATQNILAISYFCVYQNCYRVIVLSVMMVTYALQNSNGENADGLLTEPCAGGP